MTEKELNNDELYVDKSKKELRKLNLQIEIKIVEIKLYYINNYLQTNEFNGE
jgi:hypothetical protein